MLIRQIETLVQAFDDHSAAAAADDEDSEDDGGDDGARALKRQQQDDFEAALVGDFDTNEVIAVPAVAGAAAETVVDDEAGAAAADDSKAADGKKKPRTEQPASAARPSATKMVHVRDANDDRVVPVAPLPRDDEMLLRKFIAMGLIDQVCRRATPLECRSHGYKYVESDRCKGTPYFDTKRSVVTFVHPTSSVAATTPPPEWIVYAVLQKNVRLPGGAGHHVAEDAAKMFMRGVTVVRKEWIDELGYVEDPERDEAEDADI